MPAQKKNTTPAVSTSILERFATAITRWAERWFPDAYIFALLATLIVAGACLVYGVAPARVAEAFGEGFWSIIPFTMQMAMVVISGYVVATSPPIAWLVEKLASGPRTGRGAVVAVALLAIVSSLLNWALSLVLGGLFVRALARRRDLRLDYRAAGAAAYLGLGATWALGLSSSAAQLQANRESIPASLLPLTGVIPFADTIFLPQSLALLAALTVASLAVAYFSAPPDARAVTAAHLGIDLNARAGGEREDDRPGAWLERSPLLTLLVCALGFDWLAGELRAKSAVLAISNLNTYNFLFLMLGMLLTWRPRRFLDAVASAVPSVAGILIQFPLYGSLAFLLTKAQTPAGQTLAHPIAQFFVAHSTRESFSALMGIYSAVLGFFIPSGGGKWILEAPYLMQAASELRVHLGWTVMVYNAAEALPNLVNPFFMVALVGVLGLKARDIVGYTVTQLLVHAPLVLFLLWLLGRTLPYSPPQF